LSLIFYKRQKEGERKKDAGFYLSKKCRIDCQSLGVRGW
jgi:hypothetical protein